MMNYKTFVVILIVVLFAGCKKTPKEKIGVEKLEELYHFHLSTAISTLDSLMQEKNLLKQRKLYLRSRHAFKKSEPIFSFTDKENYGFLNQSPFIKVYDEDATDIKVIEASGYQVLEELIFAESHNNSEIVRHAQLMSNRLKLVKSYSSVLHYQPHHIIWMLKQSIVQVALTGLSGYDSPVLGHSLLESQLIYQANIEYMNCFKNKFNNKELSESLNKEFQTTVEVLNDDFDSFDRYSFIKDHTHKQLGLLNEVSKDWQVNFEFALAMNNEAQSLFTDSTFNLAFFMDHNKTFSKEKAELGRLLFNDQTLSTDHKFSCASCHLPELAFTDGNKLSIGQKRNSPTLTYAGLQQSFFHDGRAGSLEGQIVAVVNNETEFHSNLRELTKAVENNPEYRQRFDTVFKDGISDFNIRNAIADYIRTLSPFNSKFDKNINGVENTLTDSEKNGFNLFTGKAQCATCHFAPLFNGTLPPNFTVSEHEMIGTRPQQIL